MDVCRLFVKHEPYHNNKRDNYCSDRQKIGGGNAPAQVLSAAFRTPSPISRQFFALRAHGGTPFDRQIKIRFTRLL